MNAQLDGGSADDEAFDPASGAHGSAGWVVVLFAAVMMSIGPKLEQIARQQGVE